ncbi:MAG: glutamine-hydrolyzing carbamoyl-phosphate synthase small subunit [Clostridia bacterium]|nr:glutamine-hydrolyzing carbamoyl-phosphate synthase small subunit [Clostridia bacterium]
MERRNDCKIVLETGEVYEGVHFGAKVERVCELVFNTSVVGYQEIISDPTYANQAVVMTYPIIGNYGITDEDNETKNAHVGALIVRDYNDLPSNFRCTKTLGEILEDSGVPAIFGPDTRQLTRRIREGGECKAIITDIDTPIEECLEKIRNTALPENRVACVSCRKKWFRRTEHSRYNVVAVDCGIKNSMLRSLCKRGCNVTVVPYNTTPEEIDRIAPDGVFISIGPGSPESVPETVALINGIKGRYPVFAVCLGAQLAAISYGARIKKMPCGHRGGNHSVRNLETGKLETVAQNHGYVIDKASLKGTGLKITHENVFDGSVEGVECKKDRLFAVQYHPESVAVPKTDNYLFDKFVSLMEEK